MDTQSIQLEDFSICAEIQFALNFLCPSNVRLEHLKSQLELKLASCKGEYHYTIGLDGCGMALGLSESLIDRAVLTLQRIASEISANLRVLSKQTTEKGFLAQVLIRKPTLQTVNRDVRVALLGETQVGKSTLVGVLSRGVRENGKNSARNAILLHQHEKKLGCTATVTQHLIGFDDEGKIIKNSRKEPLGLAYRSQKLVSLIDLPGNERYRNTLLYGLISQSPDYALLMIDPSTMDSLANIEYLNLIQALQLPLIIVLSKAERLSARALDCTFDFLYSELRKTEKILMEVSNQDDVILYARTFLQENLVPVFTISFKTQKNTDLLVNFLSLLPVRNNWDELSSTEFYLEKWYNRQNSVILCGIMVHGKVSVLDKLLLGPDPGGNFHTVHISEIHVKEVAVGSVSAGQFCSFRVNSFPELRRGMVLVDTSSRPMPSYEFECLIWMIGTNQPNRVLKSSYKPLIYTQTITQCAYIIQGPKTIMPNTVMKFRFHFLYHAEYITPGTKLIIKDTFMTALGTITKVNYVSN